MRIKLFTIIALSVFALTSANLIAAKKSDELKETLFSQLKDDMANARKNKADILSPDNFMRAEKAFDEAMKFYEAGRDLETIKKNIKTADSLLKKADENVELSKLTLGKLIAAREDALVARAQEYDLDNFKTAEGFFVDAAKQVEKGNVTKARKFAEKAEPYYRKAETKAIKEGLLGDCKKIKKEADKNKTDRYSPKTYQLASAKMKEAEKFIDSQGYNTDNAQKKVEEARYELAHSIAVSERVKEAKDKKMKYEDIFLNFEKDIEKISLALGIPVSLDKGYDYQLKTILGAVDRNKKDREDLDQRLSKTTIELENKISDSNKQITEKDKEIALLKGKTAEEAERLNDLKQKLEKENQAKERYNRIKSLFAMEEGKIFKDGNDIVLQLYGLTFPSGKSTIEVENFDLLAKVQKSLREFPLANVVVEGHTDSLGDPKFNEILSDERAKAVVQYLISNKSVDENKISPVGYGETKPVASNNTPEGRAKNRRIDVIIRNK